MNISVFSNHFIECYLNYLKGTQPYRQDIESATLSEAVDFWISRKDLKGLHWCPELFMSGHPESKIADQKIFNLICSNGELRKVEKWATENVLLQVRKDWKISTQNVKTRIVCGMLNRCLQDEHKGLNIQMFNNFVENMFNLRSDLLDSDLPF